MNMLLEAFAWCIAQVTLFALVAGCAYGIARRFRAVGLATLLLVSLSIVGLLSLFALSPWPRWDVASTLRLERSAEPVPTSIIPSAASDASIATTQVRSTSLNSDHDVSISGSPALIPVQPNAPSDSSDTSIRSSDFGKSRWHVFIWAAWLASAVGVVRLVMGILHIHRCRRQSGPLADSDLTELFQALCVEFRIRRRVELRTSDRISVPATFGWRRPTVLLPGTWPTWTPDEQRAVLAHELAHVRQRHFPAWLVSQLAVVTHFYHPLVHWLSRRLRLELELAADALAATTFTDRRHYAAALAGLALGPARSPALVAPLGLFMSRPLLMRRLAMLRQSNESSSGFSRWKRGLVFIALGLAAVGAAGLRAAADGDTDLPAPTDPARTTRVIALLRASREIESVATGESQSMSDAAWKTFCSTQVAVLRSDYLWQAALRDQAIANLPIFGSPQKARGWLHRHLRVGFIADSEMMYVMAYSVPKEADQIKRIVDAVVKTFMEDVKYRETQRRHVPIHRLKESLEELTRDLSRKYEGYLAAARDLGSAEAGGAKQVEVEILVKQVNQIDTESMRLEGELLQLQTAGKAFDEKFYKLRIEQLNNLKDTRMKEIHKSQEKSVDLETDSRELQQLQRIADEMRTRLSTLEIDRNAPLRITQIHPAIATDLDDVSIEAEAKF